MKTQIVFVIQLFLTILVALPLGFAQEEVPEIIPEDEEVLDPTPEFIPAINAVDRMVRLIYLVPNDQDPQPNFDAKFDALIKETQEFFADEMERHGFARKTFRVEEDDNGDAIVHHITSNQDDEHFQMWAGDSDAARDFFADDYDTKKYIFLQAIEVSTQRLGALEFCGIFSGGVANVPASGDCFDVNIVAHELGHGFGLTHNFNDDSYIMSYGGDSNAISACAAEWLDVSPHFNPHKVINSNKNTSLQLRTSSYDETPPYALQLGFDVNDPDGLHQALLITRGEESFSQFVDCKSLQGTQDIFEFTTTQTVNIATIHVIDKQGNVLHQGFDIENTLIPPTTDIAVIPDDNLASAIREELGYAPETPIPIFDLSRLQQLNAQDHDIKDLKGLEHAVGLRDLNLNHNQIQDITPLSNLILLKSLLLNGNPIQNITPLAKMTLLNELFLDDTGIIDLIHLVPVTNLRTLLLRRNGLTDITTLAKMSQLTLLHLDNNNIRDIRPLQELTQLEKLYLTDNKVQDIRSLTGLVSLTHLYLANNQISDITPLSNMKKLKTLYLPDNQIRDVSILAELTNLEYVVLHGNLIKNRKPLLSLLRKNPQVEIYFKKEGGTLPVTLSFFRAELTSRGVMLKWTTESEVDNAGFYIYRSETKDEEFKVLNPIMIQGAGTTGERNKYTWTDTTAKPNTVYYYRIEDVSHAGVHQVMATTRLRGLVSAKRKTITQWGHYKRIVK